ncbi:hypothetical protein UFOVP46_103 [uncultured Caudovirales phage]|uniref:Uncharacterized protein n=1 Tax=uncultured Caudovirales phage TaxID=2100421 RepID=A0A6J5KS05_9CAUD|nr:hypothetical protein UFOVP46_103 [uncultured Caudovirales phage]
MSYTITMKVPVVDDAIDDIIDGAGYSIGYWASNAEVDSKAQTYTVTDSDSGKKYPLTYADIARAIQTVADGKAGIRQDIQDAITLDILDYENAERMDSEAYDVLIQLACFNEVVYG